MLTAFIPFLTLVLPSGGEDALVKRLQARETLAMAELYDRFKRLVYSIIYQAVRDQGVAEDLTQETFWRVWNRIATFDAEKGRLEPWIATVARNRAVDYLRSLRGSQQYSFESIESAAFLAHGDAEQNQVDRERLVLRALQTLNANQREMIELAHYQGLTQVEIAEHLHRPLGTVKATLRSALKVLRAALQEATA